MLLKRRIILSVVATTCLAGQGFAQMGRTEAEWHYYYFDEKRPLPLNVQRIAVLQALERAEERPDLTAVGIEDEKIEAWPVRGWYLADTPLASQNVAGVQTLVAQLVARGGMSFVSPVFVGDYDGPILITPDILVGFHDHVAAVEAEAVLATAAAGAITDRNWGNMPGVYRLRSTSRSGFDVLAAANELAQRPEVMFAEPDVVFTGGGSLIPNDPGFPLCWGLHNTGQSGGIPDMDMDAPEAWDITVGDPSVKVVIIDTGVQQNHPDINQMPGTDTTDDPSTDGGPVNEYDNHGTPVAGCVSARIGNALGTVGVAPFCLSASARTFIGINYGGNWDSQASWTVDTLTWAESIGARVTNNSNYYGFQSSSIANKYATTRSAGMVHFSSANNDGLPIISYPASLSTVNAVAALTRWGTRASFSNYGPGLAFSAPGDFVYTTDRTGFAGWSSGDYVYASGTSFASPYSAGVAALVLSEMPALDADGVEQLLQNASVDLGSPGYDTDFGWGFINAWGPISPVTAPISAAHPHDTKKNRYVSINPGTNPGSVGLRVDLASMKRCSGLPSRACSIGSDCETAVPGSGTCVEHADVGSSWWVQAPQQEPLGCLPGPCGDEDWFARVDGTPYFDAWTLGTLHIGDCEVIPVATYEIRACLPPDGIECSAPLTIGTIAQPFVAPGFRGNYGDAAGTVDEITGDFTPPDGFTNVVDVSAYILTKQNYGTANKPQTHPTWVDLHGLGDGNPPQYILNITDMGQIKKAIVGDAWTDDPGNMNPGQCP